MLTGRVTGNGGERTRLAIEKYLAMEACCAGEIDVDEYCVITNEIYKAKMRLGCPKCGAAKRFGIGLCRRCYRLHGVLRNEYPATPKGFVFRVQKQFQEFAKTIGANKRLGQQRRKALSEEVKQSGRIKSRNTEMDYSLRNHCERCQKQGVCECGCRACLEARRAAREEKKK